jgi:hypothetical protein
MIRHKLIKLAIVVLVLTGVSADAKVVSCQYQKADGTICRWLCVSKSIDTTIHDPFCGQCDTYVEGGGCVAPKSCNSCCYEIDC